MDSIGELRAELEQLTRALEASRARFRSLIVRNADAIILVDREGVVCFANPAAEELFGRSVVELVGTVFGFPVVAGETTELDIIGRRGQPIVAEMRVVETEWEGAPALLASLRDITERKRAETERTKLLREQAARAEAEAAVRARDEFLSIASHELRTPITSIRASTQLALRQLHDGRLDPDRLRLRLELIEQQTGKLTSLVAQLLDVSRLQAGQLALDRRPTDVARLVREVVATAAERTDRHTLRVEAPPELVALVDPLRLEQVLTNLLDNAVKYSPAGGPIEVGVRCRVLGVGDSTADERSSLTPEPQHLTSFVELIVADNGLGVPPGHRDGLFDRFHQAHRDDHRSGLGLGLYISRQIARLHGGDIRAEFPPDGGTRMIVALPRGPE